MTDCPDGELRDLLPDLLHGGLDPAQRAAVESHVAGCADCRGELALLGGLRGSMTHLPSVDVGRIVAALPTYRAPVRRHWGRWRAAAAIAAVALGGTSLAIATRDDAEPAPAARSAVSEPAAQGPVGDSPGTPVQRVAVGGPIAGSRMARASATRELALEEGLGDLSEGELTMLLEEIESLDVLPVVDVEATPLVPASALPASAGGAS